MKPVLYEKRNNIAYITLNRPEQLNSITLEAVDELNKIWIDFRDDNNLWVAILSGNGKSFCAGADVGDMEHRQRKSFSELITLGDKVIGPNRHKIWKPIIAAIHRHVIGAGFWLVMESDIVIAADDLKIGAPESNLGIPVAFTSFLRDQIGWRSAAEILLIGDLLNAQRAYELGIVNKVVSKEELIPTATRIAERICENGPLAIRAMKEIASETRYMDYQSTLAFLESIVVPIAYTEDVIEGRQAWREKRKPQWKGK
jgi:E-phenylitaconyl-CoA hydratase